VCYLLDLQLSEYEKHQMAAVQIWSLLIEPVHCAWGHCWWFRRSIRQCHDRNFEPALSIADSFNMYAYTSWKLMDVWGSCRCKAYTKKTWKRVANVEQQWYLHCISEDIPSCQHGNHRLATQVLQWSSRLRTPTDVNYEPSIAGSYVSYWNVRLRVSFTDLFHQQNYNYKTNNNILF